MHVLPDQNPGGKLAGKPTNRRWLLLAAAGGGLLLFLFARSSSASSAAATDPNAAALAPAGAVDPTGTVADNGGQAAQLGSDVTDALSQQGMALSGLSDSVNQLMQSLPDLVATNATGTPAAPVPPSSPVTINVGATGPAGAPAGARAAAAAPRPAAAAPLKTGGAVPATARKAGVPANAKVTVKQTAAGPEHIYTVNGKVVRKVVVKKK